MANLFCKKTGSVITGDSICLECDNFYKQVKDTFISCPEIRQIDDANINTVLPLSESTIEKKGMDVVQEAKEKIKEEEKAAKKEIVKTEKDGDKSVWDESVTLTKQPAFSLPKKAFLTEIK